MLGSHQPVDVVPLDAGSVEDLGHAQVSIRAAVDRFQTHLVELRRERAAQIQRELDAVLDRLGELEGRFRAQLTLSLGEVSVSDAGLSPTEKRRATIRRAKEQQIERLFEDWAV